ncbi:MmyB family transcriptional regulator [Novacetimonas hansenii]|nr:XRE family transcriptional regulator [Novacetimonas hansenii]
MLARIATALHLSSAERLYLFELAQMKDPDASRPSMASDLPEEVRIFPEQMAVPCYVLDPLWNACAANDAARHLFAGWLDDKERNLLRYVFLAPGARTFLDDWESSARRVLAEFRAVSIRGDTEQVDALVQELRSLSPDFERLWHNQSVLLREGGPRKFNHPIDGRVDFDQTIPTFTTWSQYQLVALKPR